MTCAGSGSVLGDEWDSASAEANQAIPDLEEGHAFMPRFGPDGILPAIAVSAKAGDVLMLAYMNKQALELTLKTGEAHFWSRSKQRLWKKGEESGNTMQVVELRTDCDQDTLLLKVEMKGKPAACHTGRRSCFYRAVEPSGHLRFVDAERLFDPAETYGHAKAAREP
jgi:phosphoribosyl-AMP cyclohydrolase